MSRRRRLSPGRRLGFAAVTTALALASLEGMARLALPAQDARPPVIQATGERYPAFCTPDPEVGWVPTPHATGLDPIWVSWARRQGLDEQAGEVANNARGLRDDPISPPVDGRPRVLALGDSSLWGSGVRPARRFSELLQNDLSVDVLNAGVSGYSTWQARALFEDLADLQPQAVLLYLMNSDMDRARVAPDDQWFQSRLRRRGAASLRRSALARALQVAVTWARPPRHATARVHVRHYANNLRALAQAAAPAPVVAVIPPTEEDLSVAPAPYLPQSAAQSEAWRAEHAALARRAAWDVEQPVAYRRALALVMAEVGGVVVDGPEALRRAASSQPGPWFVDPVHPTEAGHAVLAQAIAPALAAALPSVGQGAVTPAPQR